MIIKYRTINLLVILIEIFSLSIFYSSQSPEILNITNIQTCGYFKTTGLYCSTCGVTRSIYAFLNFDFFKSIQFNWIGFVLCILILTDITLRIYCFVKSKYFIYHQTFHIFCICFFFISSIINYFLLNYNLIRIL